MKLRSKTDWWTYDSLEDIHILIALTIM
jgi:hypothetical protein